MLGASVGLALGTALNHYMLNLFGPPLIAEFGWSRSQFALVGSLGLLSMLFMPIAGRFADKVGTRVAATVGFAILPPCYFLLSIMTGDIRIFYAILLLKNVIGILTTTFVFSRVVVERFERARGLALACLLSGPPLAGAIAAPLIGGVIENEGWRTAYQVMAVVSALGGLTAVLLVGRGNKRTALATRPQRMNWSELRSLARQPVFLLMIGGMFFCNLPQVLVSSQMNLMLMDNGASAAFATALVSLYAICVILGRFVSGWALDRVPPHYVAIVALGLPTLGYLALATTIDARWVLAGAIALVGLAQGAETDVGAILTSRKFDMAHYSFIFSLMMTSLGIASALGSILLSVTLATSESFNPFLIFSGIITLAGAACFYLTGRYHAPHEPAGEPA